MSFTADLDQIVAENRSGLLGVRPHWKRARLKDVATILNGYPFESSRFRNDRGTPLIRIRDVVPGKTETYYDGDFDATYLVRHGDLLVGMDGDFNSALWAGEQALLNQRVCKINPDESKYSKRFLAYVLPGYLAAINAQTPSVTVKHLSSRTIADIPLPLPPLDEQRWIVEELEKQFTRLDSGLAALRRAKASLQRYRAAVLKTACDGHLIATDLSRWSRLAVSAVGKTITGNTPPTGDGRNFGDEIPFFKPTDLDAGYNVRTARQYLSAKGAKHARMLPAGAVLVTCIGATIGKTGFARVSCATNQQINALVSNPEIALPEWVFWSFSGPALQQQIKDNASATTLPILNKSKFQALELPIPPLAEQSRIVAEVERRLSVVNALEQSLCETEARVRRLRESILRSQFGGENDRKRPQPPPQPTNRPTGAAHRVSVHSPPAVKSAQRPPETPSNAAVSPDDISGIKLLRFQLFEDFNSLKAFDYTYRRNEVPESVVSPLCFVGLNGSGKSNLLEALSEALCSTELFLLPWKSAGRVRNYRALRFILEYTLTRKQRKPAVHVRIERIDRRRPQFHIVDGDTVSPVTRTEECLRLLPPKILGYSSGLNETISVPYLKTAALYSEEVRNQAREDWKARQKSLPVASSRVLFMDYECNALILVANYLFASAGTLAMFRRALRIDRLASFDLRFRPSFQRTREVALTTELKNYLDSFSACADDVHRGVAGIRTFRFFRDGAGIQKLRDRFHTAENFFAAIYQLSLLNALALKGRDRGFYLKRTLKEGQLERPPTVAREDRIFSVENIRLALSRPRKVIDYAAISDGEHQFLQVLGAVTLFNQPGSLFILDEPETHFNPQWRRRLVQLLNQIRTTAGQEFLVSTHSPFVVSGCRGSGVFLFERKGQSSISRPAGFETFGASYDVLLERLFGLKTMIAGQAAEELRVALKSDKIEILEDAAMMLGDSFEKRFLFEKIVRLKARKQKRG